MTDNNLLYGKVAAIQPPADLKPGAVMVAILRPDKTANDDIEDIDIVWIKCPRKRSVSTLLGAYKQRSLETAKLRLIQNDTVLEESRIVDSLDDKDRLCVIEAVREHDLQQRLNTRSNANVSSPLRDITKNAVNRSTAPSSLPREKTKEPSQNFGSHSLAAPSRMNPPSISTVLTTPNSAVAENVLFQSPILLAWTDFYFERSEYLSRLYSLRLNCEETYSYLRLQIADEWQRLVPEQRQYFVERVRKLKIKDAQEHRAFWSFYFENSDARIVGKAYTTPSIDRDIQLFDKMVSNWNSFDSVREHYRTRIRLQQNASSVPPLPFNSTLPVSKSQTSRSPEASDLSTPQLSIHSTSPEIQTPINGSVSETCEPKDEFAESLRLEASMPARLNISELFDGLSTEQLESGVETGVEILSSIKEKLQTDQSADSEQWLSLIANVEKQAVKTKTIVGVVGATGAGKSSVINAMLDQERLVPTNCMRACTAVVTEISYNNGEIPFRAEIDFIDQEDWMKELKTSFDDLFDGSGKVSRECNNEDSEAGVAYAKIKAVYPLMTKENMENTSIEKLMNHSNVKNVLGKSRTIEDEDSAVFYKMLQKYVDSKEKMGSREKKTDLEKAKAKEMEFWPLIRVVRIYVKAPALATGAVIVDLPGVHDSNQARAAVAQGYLKQCTGLWIVAPITRAVDDKSAKTLLGDSFKRQLKMDGGYNSVTFICSKTDDISITEAQDSLGLDEEVAPLYARSEELRKKLHGLKAEFEELKSTKSDVSAVADSADEELEVWEKLEEDLELGKTVYAPKPEAESKKRKRSGSTDSPPRKKSKYCELSDDDDDFVVDDGSEAGNSDDDEKSEENRGEPLTAETVSDKIQELKTTKKNARHERSDLEQKIKELRVQILEVTKEQDEIDAELSGKCIKGRNEYSRGAIQQDFAAGVRELDQEIAEEEDAANFNPEVDVRDYDEVAKTLPVFCVSSRGYQKLMGRLKKDKSLSSFRNIDETEVPALQAHCTKLTITNRETACKRFLNSLSHLLNSLRLWSSSDGSGANLTGGQLKREVELLNSNFAKLDNALEKEIKQVLASIKTELQDHLFDLFPQAVSLAKNEASDIQAQWGAPVNRENRSAGGLYWATYKATVRRDGAYSENHFNEDLIEPVIKKVTPGWDKVFSRRLPQTLFSIANTFHQVVVTFHEEVEKRSIKNGTSLATFQMLRQQLPTYKETVKDLADTTRQFIVAKQKDINREFVPAIMNAMLPAYATATFESGPGSYKRMKEAVARHVDQVKTNMFQDSVNSVRALLEKMLDECEALMLAKVDEILLAIKRDYESVVLGDKTGSASKKLMPRQQRTIRKEVRNIVDDVEHVMKRVAGMEHSEEPEEALAEHQGGGETAIEVEPVENEINAAQDVKLEDDDVITNQDVTAESNSNGDSITEDIKPNNDVPSEDVIMSDSADSKDVKVDDGVEMSKDMQHRTSSTSSTAEVSATPDVPFVDARPHRALSAADIVDQDVKSETSTNKSSVDSQRNFDDLNLDINNCESPEHHISSETDDNNSSNDSSGSSPDNVWKGTDENVSESPYESDVQGVHPNKWMIGGI